MTPYHKSQQFDIYPNTRFVFIWKFDFTYSHKWVSWANYSLTCRGKVSFDQHGKQVIKLC